MNKSGPIIIIDDGINDHVLLKEAFDRLGYRNKVVYFKGANEALDYIRRSDVHPFLILSDLRLPEMDAN